MNQCGRNVLKMKKILIVEDEPDVAVTIKMLLDNLGYDAAISLKPKEAIKTVKNYDMVLLDILMPEMDGYEFLARMKKDNLKIPVIVVSATGVPEEEEKKINAKYPHVGFVSKIDIGSKLMAEIKRKFNE